MKSLLITLVFLTMLSPSHGADETYDDNTAVVTETVETHQCKTNEIWMECGTCENKCGEPRVPCPRMCKPARCQCLTHKGFRRNNKGECVKCD